LFARLMHAAGVSPGADQTLQHYPLTPIQRERIVL